MKRWYMLLILLPMVASAGVLESLQKMMNTNAQEAPEPKQAVQAKSPQDTMKGLGTVTQGGTPVPGLSVYLVSKKHGRSFPLTTDDQGRFSFSSVTPSENEHDHYFIQVYWGKTLVYQGKLLVLDISPVTNIVLEKR